MILYNIKKYIVIHNSLPLHGVIYVPTDKLISYIALIAGSISSGKTYIKRMFENNDINHTVEALIKLGIIIKKRKNIWVIYGCGNGCLIQPNSSLYFDNDSSIGIILIMGLVATYNMYTTFKLNEYLSKISIDKVLKPLELMGVQIIDKSNKYLHITLRGPRIINPIIYENFTKSHHIKSAILLAGLNLSGLTTIIESKLTIDHTERILNYFGSKIKTKSLNYKKKIIKLIGQRNLTGKNITIPGDISCAAFVIGAGLIVPNSNIIIRNVLINNIRLGFVFVLIKMGAQIKIFNRKEIFGEQVADIKIKHSILNGITIYKDLLATIINEYPIIIVISAFANGKTIIYGLKELKIKESNIIKCIINNLRINGVICTEGSDYIMINGSNNKKVQGGGKIINYSDHRIAMSFFIMGLFAKKNIIIDNINFININFPNFLILMKKLGANFTS